MITAIVVGITTIALLLASAHQDRNRTASKEPK